MGVWTDEQLAAVLANSVYERAAGAMAAGMEQCEEHRELTEVQKATLLKGVIAHFQGLEREFCVLISSAHGLDAALGDGRSRT